MKAEFDSKCASCGEWIEEGDEITKLEDDGEWVHEDCAEELDDSDEYDHLT